MDSKANGNKSDKETEKERWERMYRHMGHGDPEEQAIRRINGELGSEDEEEDKGAEEGGGEDEDDDEIECANCGHGPGAFPDDALDMFTENRDGEPVHYGCRSSGM